MVATVRLDSNLEQILNSMTQKFHKGKSEIIREAISFYAQSLENTKKSKLQKAIQKTYNADFKEYKNMEDTLNDGL